MMICPNAGKVKLLKTLFALDNKNDYVIRLFKNDYEPAADTVTASFEEATFTGYFPYGADGDGWDVPDVVDDIAEMSLLYPPVYTCTGGAAQMVYGWYMVGSTHGITVLTQRFSTPRLMGAGAVVELDPFTVKFDTFKICG